VSLARGVTRRELAGLLGGPASVGVRGAACNVHASAAELEEEEHVEASEPERVDRKEIAGDDRLGVRAQELAPAELGASASRRNTCCRRILATVVAETPMPTPASSPTIRWYPQREFSRASRSTNSRISSETAGRPGRRPAYVHRLRTSWRCQPSSVSGRTKNDGRLARPSSRLAAARKTRSLASSRGRGIWRRRTASSCGSTTISISLNSRERSRSAATASARRKSRYSNDTIKRSLPRPNPKRPTLRLRVTSEGSRTTRWICAPDTR
jgi:hypothetical protein